LGSGLHALHAGMEQECGWQRHHQTEDHILSDEGHLKLEYALCAVFVAAL